MSLVLKKVLLGLITTHKTWLVTGVAGFIGSNLLEALLKLDQKVIGLDNLITGNLHNLNDVEGNVTPKQWANFTFNLGDIRSSDECLRVSKGVDYILHHAVIGSVSRTNDKPNVTNDVNVKGYLNMLIAAKVNNVANMVYATSDLGSHPVSPYSSDGKSQLLSHYAVTKHVNEVCSGPDVKSTGLRYFNVFGKRQNPEGAYAAVIPKWVNNMVNGKKIKINGDVQTNRDFCYVENVIKAKILAATAPAQYCNQVFNVACGDINTLNDLFELIRMNLARYDIEYKGEATFTPYKQEDVPHLMADISKTKKTLGYNPLHDLSSGLSASIMWYINDLLPRANYELR